MIKPRVLGQQLNKEIVGQDRALEAVVRSVVVADLGVADPQRPLASFLFIGPTGTGKSQLGRSLAKALHNDAGAVITVNPNVTFLRGLMPVEPNHYCLLASMGA